MSFLQVSEISRQEGDTFQLQLVSFTQAPLHKLAIAGATGSGKSTLLKIIAGLLQPQSGSVHFDGERVLGPEEKLMPGHPRIAYLSQHFELLNHYRVEELLDKSNQLSNDEAALVYEVCAIEHLLKRWTHQLSGGERQRIALARLLVTAPRLLLLDEPYSNLDAIHKNILKAVIEAISDNLNITTILVSHDPVDLLSWADTILVLQNGKLIQNDTVQEIYLNPVSHYAAALFGKYTLMNPALAKAFSLLADIDMQSINRFFRPDQFVIVPDESLGLKGEIIQERFMGSYRELEIEISGTVVVLHNRHGHFKKGDTVFVALV